MTIGNRPDGTGPSMRAFLSHSHRDAELVHAVAKAVGRPFVALDEWSFETGDELIAAMNAAISESAVFVLFLSRTALESIWVNYEIDRARYEAATRRLERVITFVIDGSIANDEIPEWLTRFRYERQQAARPMARAVRTAIDDLVRARQQPFFVGRSRETAMLQDYLAPTDGSDPARVFTLVGLDGIGRQTLLRRIVRDLLNFPRILRIPVESGDSVQDIAAKIADLVEPITSPAESAAMVREMQQSGEPEALRRVLQDLARAASNGELPYVFDRGGLLDGDGRLMPAVREIVNGVRGTPDLYLALVTNRRPQREHVETPSVDVRPLVSAEIRRLIAALARRAGLELRAEQLNRLASDVSGYPPAATFSVELLRTYGVDLVLAERERVVAFRTNPLLQYLRSIELDSLQRASLRILAGASPLPLTALCAALQSETESLAGPLAALIDASLAVPNDSGWYEIASPVRDSVEREYGTPTSQEYARVAAALDEFLQETDGEGSYLELARVRFRALVLSGMAPTSAPLEALAADWIQLTQRLYHQRDYEEAIRVGRAATEARPRNPDPRMWLIRALIKTEHYDEAEQEIRTLRQLGSVQDASYLTGFLERSRSELYAAIDAYRAAVRAGYRGIAVHRELALCYFRLGNLSEARRHIEDAQARQRDNPYVVDLMIQIACAQNDEETARRLLAVLEAVDTEAFAKHRRSVVEAQFGSAEAAYEAARAAARLEARPAFEVLGHLILCEIRTRRHDDAQRHLRELEDLYPRRNLDVRMGLECRAAIERGRYEEALGHWERIRDRTRSVHLKLKRDAITGLLAETSLPSADRERYLDELRDLEERLADTVEVEFGPLLSIDE